MTVLLKTRWLTESNCLFGNSSIAAVWHLYIVRKGKTQKRPRQKSNITLDVFHFARSEGTGHLPSHHSLLLLHIFYMNQIIKQETHQNRLTRLILFAVTCWPTELIRLNICRLSVASFTKKKKQKENKKRESLSKFIRNRRSITGSCFCKQKWCMCAVNTVAGITPLQYYSILITPSKVITPLPTLFRKSSIINYSSEKDAVMLGTLNERHYSADYY